MKFARGRVLIVDDDRGSRQFMEDALGASVQTVSVASGSEALDVLNRTDDIALILLDVVLPDINGFEVARHLENIEMLRDIPVFFVTGAAFRTNMIDEGFALGGSDFLAKPIQPALLRNKVLSTLVRRHKARIVSDLFTEMVDPDQRASIASVIEPGPIPILATPASETHDNAEAVAYQNGRAEIASSVLHNVGNILNSSSVSAKELYTSLSDRKPVRLLTKLKAYLEADREQQEPSTWLRLLDGIIELLEVRRKIHRGEAECLMEHMARIFQVMRQLEASTWGRGESRALDPGSILEEACEITSRTEKCSAIELSRSYQHLSEIHADQGKLFQIYLNLLENACEAAVETDEPKPIVRVRTYEREEHITIEIEDNGPGIPAYYLPKIFRFGFTTKPSRVGFGLHYCGITLQEMGGSIEVLERRKGRGTVFRLILRKAADAPDTIPVGSSGAVGLTT